MLSRTPARLMAEYALPAMSVGGIGGLAAGGLAAVAGQPTSWAILIGLGLGVPLALVGAGYAVLVAIGRFPVGIFTPAGLYWMVGFPLAMLVHEVVTRWLVLGHPALPAEPLLEFLAYNALLSVGFAFGFIWVEERIGRVWWPRIRGHNPYAERRVEAHKATAMALQEQKAARRRSRGKGLRNSAHP